MKVLAVLRIDGLGRSGHIDKVKAGQSVLEIEKCLCHDRGIKGL